MTEAGTAPSPAAADFFRAFAQGVTAVVLVYGAALVYIWSEGPAYLQSLAPVVVATPAQHEPEAEPVVEDKPLFGPFMKEIMGPPTPTTVTAHEENHHDAPAESATHAEAPHGEEHKLTPAHHEEEAAAAHDDGHSDADPFAGLPRTAGGLIEAPVAGLFEEKPVGKVPVAGKDRFTPFNAYRRPWTAPAGEPPVVALALYGVGISDSASHAALKDFPADVSLVLSPYAADPELWVKEGRAKGHEIWLSLPLETRDYPRSDPGPYTIMTGLSEKENADRLYWLMSRASGYAGLVAPYDSLFSMNPNALRAVLSEVFKRGLGYIGSSRDTGTMSQSLALGMNAPFAQIDVWVGWPSPTAQGVREALTRLENLAREQGYAAGAVDLSALSRSELALWLQTLEGRGFTLAPLSAITGF